MKRKKVFSGLSEEVLCCHSGDKVHGPIIGGEGGKGSGDAGKMALVCLFLARSRHPE